MKFKERLIIFIIGVVTGITGLLAGVWISEERAKGIW